MRKYERIIWISMVMLLLFISLFGIFINKAWAATVDGKLPNFKKLVEVYNLIEKSYVDEKAINQDKMINGAIEGMLNSLGDQHTTYLSEEMMKEMDTTSTGKYGGVGMIIAQKGDNIVVVSPMEGYPAYKKGIKAGDIILSVDGKSLKGVTVSEAADLLRGEAGTKVSVEIQSNDIKYQVDLKRDIIDLPSVKYDLINNKYGYLRIVQFAGTTSKHVKEALQNFRKNKVKAVIVDLRYNPGGLLSQVIDIVDYFQDEGIIVSTIGRSDFDNSEAKASKLTTIVDDNIPVIVLIDKGSASASEIFAGAIKDNKRGILIGEKTFGKGSVQTIFRLGKDGLKMTIAKYYTPSGICIDGIGINPDIEVKDPELTDQEKESLKKLYDNKVIDKIIADNPNPTPEKINELVDKLQKQGYNLSTRDLKKIIKNAVEIGNSEKNIYDLDYDIQLKKALEILDQNKIIHSGNSFILEKGVADNTSDKTDSTVKSEKK